MSIRPLNILVIEDNPGDFLLIRRALATYNVSYNLSSIEDGEKALEFIDLIGKPRGTPCPDLLLLDLKLPSVSGMRVLGEFRKHQDCVHTPVIVVTHSDSSEDRKLATDLGVSQYFRKPANLKEYMALGLAVLDAARLGGLNSNPIVAGQ
jgi:two-component system response regulator